MPRERGLRQGAAFSTLPRRTVKLYKPKRLGYTGLGPTVVDVSGYAVRVFTKDHGDPHVHVFHNGSLIRISLLPVEFDSI